MRIVTLGGKSVSLAAYSPKSITATLPQPVTVGDYTLKVVNASGSATFDLTLANLATPAPLVVVDSTGKVVGSYLPVPSPLFLSSGVPDSVFIRTSNLSFAVSIASLYSYSTGNPTGYLYYTSSDCTGTAYQQVAYPRTMPTVAYAGVFGSTAEIVAPSTMPTDVTVSSQLYFNSGCTTYGPGALTVVPVVATFDLSTLNLVPPFSVQ